MTEKTILKLGSVAGIFAAIYMNHSSRNQELEGSSSSYVVKTEMKTQKHKN